MGRLDPLFSPRGVVVLGVSRDSRKLGSVMYRSLSSFPGPVLGVNPNDAGSGFFHSVKEAVTSSEVPIDLAVLCIPGPSCVQALEEVGQAGVKAALVCAGGFTETGMQGSLLQESLLNVARNFNVALLGPNTSGFMVPARGLFASFVPGVETLVPGPIAVVAASGGVNHALAFLLARRGVGLSLGVGLGNAADVGPEEVLTYLAKDQVTKAIGLHIESVQDGPALLEAIAEVSTHLPVVALVVGRSDVSEFAASHTGAMATSWRVTRAALRDCGALLVDDERQLIDALVALSTLRLPAKANPRVGVVTAQAGPGLLHADALRAHGVELPRLSTRTLDHLARILPPLTFQANPVDTGRPGPDFAEVVATVGNDPQVDLVSIYALEEPTALDLPRALEKARSLAVDAHISTGQQQALFVVGLGGTSEQVAKDSIRLLSLGIPALEGPSALSNAVLALLEDAKSRVHGPSILPGPAEPEERLDLPQWFATCSQVQLGEDQAKEILESLGIKCPPRQVCNDREEALRAFDEIRPPMAIKLLDATVAHKSDIGGVHLGIRNARELMEALDNLEGAGARRFLMESMVQEGVDLILGAFRDPVFGPMVLVGLGGVAAEAIDDVAIAKAPLSPDRGARLLGDLNGARLLDGFRGTPTVNREVVGSLIARLGSLVTRGERVVSVEINPFRITHDGMFALDALIALQPLDHK